MANPLRVGVVGLGRRWHRQYLPAVLGLRDRFRLQAVCDQVQQRALVEAQQFSCRAAVGPTELLEADDVDAVLLVDPQWYRLWPVEVACRLHKPVFCYLPLELDAGKADALEQQARESGVPVLMARSPRLAPVTARLRELLAGPLGPCRLVACQHILPAQARQPALETASLLPIPTALVDWCLSCFADEPARARAITSPAADFAGLLLDFRQGQAAHVSRWRAPIPRPSLSLHVVAERGSAWVEYPRRLSWSSPDGQHTLTLPKPRPAARVLLEGFLRLLSGEAEVRAGLSDAVRALRWLRAAAP